MISGGFNNTKLVHAGFISSACGFAGIYDLEALVRDFTQGKYVKPQQAL